MTKLNWAENDTFVLQNNLNWAENDTFVFSRNLFIRLTGFLHGVRELSLLQGTLNWYLRKILSHPKPGETGPTCAQKLPPYLFLTTFPLSFSYFMCES